MTATLTTLASFDGADGSKPDAGVTVGATGDLFGATAAGGADGDGAVFELAKSGGRYDTPPTLLANFTAGGGTFAEAGLLADAAGDLFGEMALGGTNGAGTVYELVNNGGGDYTPTTLVNFNGADGQYPYGGLIADAARDLFGTTTAGGANDDGEVFEIAKSGSLPTGFASTATPLYSFGAAAYPSGLITDARGDLFGETQLGGSSNDGVVFELINSGSGKYTFDALVSFDGANGSSPQGGLFADTAGDVFGTTGGGGPDGDGTVFELVNDGGSYTLKTLFSFDLTNGQFPSGGVIADAAGDLFGTTFAGGDNNDGAVFELVNGAGGSYTMTTLASFNGTDGNGPEGSLTADANGDLFGTTEVGGPFDDGTVFEITDSGFVAAPLPPPPVTSDILWQSTDGQAAIWDMSGTNVVGGGSVNPNPGPSWKTIGTGNFFGVSDSDILWQNTDGQAAIWEMSGTDLVGGGTVSANPGPSWHAVGTGDFNDDGRSDILLQSTSGEVAVWEMKGANIIGGGVVSSNPGPSWKAVGTGDFNDDGRSDILFQNVSGQAAIWEMDGNTLIGGGTVSPNPGPSWKLVGSGDFNNDGHSDLLWQNASSGQVAIWEMNGTTIIGGGTVASNPGPSWHAIGAGVEGTAPDILFQSTSGQTAIWDMKGTSIVGGGTVSANAGPSWRAVGLT